jgi:hypothetical protein
MENFGQEMRSIVIRSLHSKEEREVDSKLAHIASVRWSFDGTMLLIAGTDGQGRGGLFETDATSGETKLLLRDDSGGTGGLDAMWIGPSELAYIAADGIRVRSADGRSRLVAQGSGFSLLTASSGRLAWLASDGIRLWQDGRTAVLVAPASTLTELVFAKGTLLAGNGKDLWSVPLDRSAAKPLAWKTHRSGRLSIHPQGNHVAYTTGGTASTVHRMKLAQ